MGRAAYDLLVGFCEAHLARRAGRRTAPGGRAAQDPPRALARDAAWRPGPVGVQP